MNRRSCLDARARPAASPPRSKQAPDHLREGTARTDRYNPLTGLGGLRGFGVSIPLVMIRGRRERWELALQGLEAGDAMARTFGTRFLEEFQRAGGTTSTWSPEAIDMVKRAERRQFIDAFGKVSRESAKALTIAAHTAEPETLARRAAAKQQADWALANESSDLFFPIDS